MPGRFTTAWSRPCGRRRPSRGPAAKDAARSSGRRGRGGATKRPRRIVRRGRCRKPIWRSAVLSGQASRSGDRRSFINSPCRPCRPFRGRRRRRIGGFFGSGFSTTNASVVRTKPAIEAAFCTAERVTFAGSTMPAFTRSAISPVTALRPKPGLAFRTFSTITEPSRPAFSAICPKRLFESAPNDVDAGQLVAGHSAVLKSLCG